MKKHFRFIGKLFLWILYLMITGKERQMHMYAKYRKREVLDVKNGIVITTFKMGSYLGDKLPERNYMTWKEYRKSHKF